jgi:excisionase family DNA binding protein
MARRADEPARLEGRLLSVAAVAERLGVSQKTVRRMIDRGELPAHRVGKLLRIGEGSLDGYLAARRLGNSTRW